MKGRIYISLPISRDAEKARQRADLVKMAWSKEGAEPVTPFDIYVGKNTTYEDYLNADLRTLATCESVYFDEGWESSPGCRIERAYVENINAHRREHEPEKSEIHIIEWFDPAKKVNNIIKDSFRDHNRLHIASVIMAGLLASGKEKHPVRRTLELTDALIIECKKG